jgi:uncharacterized protein YecA (UPF0149 family)
VRAEKSLVAEPLDQHHSINKHRSQLITAIKQAEADNLQRLDKLNLKELQKLTSDDDVVNQEIFKTFCFLLDKSELIGKQDSHSSPHASEDLILVIIDRFLSNQQIDLFIQFLRQYDETLGDPVDCDYFVNYTALNVAQRVFNLKYEVRSV